MKDRLNGWKEMLGKGGKNQWVIFLLVGMLLLVIAIPTGKEEEAYPETEVFFEEITEDKAEKLEERLEKALSQVAGVGKVKVLITLKSDGKKLVEKDQTTSSRSSEDQDADAGSSTVREESLDEETIYEKDGSGKESPYVTEQVEPEVAGVLVVAEGGDNSVIVSGITEAVQALFGIEVHKIKVMKMN